MSFYPVHRLMAQTIILFAITFGLSVEANDPCDAGSCYPATGNLVIGRGDKLTASSTCGLQNEEKYCLVHHLHNYKRCYQCDSRNETLGNPALNHRIDNIVHRFAPGTQKRSWWQSQGGVENVTIQLDLEAVFQMTSVIIIFKSYRPAAMTIERSNDYGKTWKVSRYFADNCEELYPGVPIKKSLERRRKTWQELAGLIKPKPVFPKLLFYPICESAYSKLDLSTEGEVIYRSLPRSHYIDDPYAEEVQDLLNVTNIRFNFKKLHTINSDELSDGKLETKEKYLYAIYDIAIRGSCHCNGHASKCLPLDGQSETMPFNMVHPKCDCSHNTQGTNCEKCLDLYNDLPWMNARGTQSNACKRCECNNHALSCHFDENVFKSTGGISGGVCDNCQHNTTGRKCDQCKEGFYLVPEMHISEPDACQPLIK